VEGHNRGTIEGRIGEGKNDKEGMGGRGA